MEGKSRSTTKTLRTIPPDKGVLPKNPYPGVAPDYNDRSPLLPPVDIPALTVTVPPTPFSTYPTDTVMENPVPDTAYPSDKIILPLLPDYSSTVLIVTIPLTQLVTALPSFHNIAPDLVMPLPKPVVPVTQLTNTDPPVV